MSSSVTISITTSTNLDLVSAEENLLQNLKISPNTAIVILTALSVWNGLLFALVLFYIMKKTDWLQNVDIAFRGRKHRRDTDNEPIPSKAKKQKRISFGKETTYEDSRSNIDDYA